MNRRRFLSLSAFGTAALHPAVRALGQSGAAPVTLTIARRPTGHPIAADFTGLSYESAQLADPEFFKGDNYQLIELVRGLGADGVLRIGGNTSEYCFWKQNPQAKSAASDAAQEAVGPDKGNKAPPRRVITEQAVRNLRDFVDATGWSLIYGLNLGQGSPEMAAEEAAYVVDVMGDRLIAFQMANEPDLFYKNGLRPASYNSDQFIVEWRRFFEAVRARVPNAPFAGPDTAFNNDWLVPFAKAFHSDLKFVSSHYYAEGPPTNPEMTIARLLRADPKLAAEFAGLQLVTKETGLPFRIAETNSCYGGGKQGVSDTFASALWGADYMFRIAQAGGIGVNFHGGGYGWYTPIAGTRAKGFEARPLYYGMSLFKAAAGLPMLETTLDSTPDGLRVYAFHGRWREANGGLWIAALNLNETNAVQLRFTPRDTERRVSVVRLTAASLSQTSGVTLGGLQMPSKASEEWKEEPVAPAWNDGVFQVSLPPASGALIHCQAPA